MFDWQLCFAWILTSLCHFSQSRHYQKFLLTSLLLIMRVNWHVLYKWEAHRNPTKLRLLYLLRATNLLSNPFMFASRSTLCSVMAQLTEDIQPSFETTLKSKAVSEKCNVKFTCVVSGRSAFYQPYPFACIMTRQHRIKLIIKRGFHLMLYSSYSSCSMKTSVCKSF